MKIGDFGVVFYTYAVPIDCAWQSYLGDKSLKMQTSFVCDARDGTTIRPHVFGKVQLSRHSFFLYVLIE